MNPALEGLRDIHLPPEPSWWPPAPGWWLLAVVCLALLGWLCTMLRNRWRKRRYRRQAVRELRSAVANLPPAEQPAHINALLKRTALKAYPEQHPAGLCGSAWTGFLAQKAPLDPQQTAALASLADGHYRVEPPTAHQSLASAAAQWIRRHR